MRLLTQHFLKNESGAVTVDWTTLSAAAVGLSLATAAVLSGTLDMVISRLDGELRDQQMSDSFVSFASSHFEPLYENNLIDPETAQDLFSTANEMLNQEIIDALQYGIEALEAGQLTPADAAALMAVASVAYQRNLVSDQILNYYFGFDGSPARINDAL